MILNNLEYDHSDIFENLEVIEKQFHHLVRTVPGNGLIIYPHGDSSIEVVLRMGSWTPRQQLGIAIPDEICKKLAANDGVFWNALLRNKQGSEFELIKYGQGATGEVMNRVNLKWDLTGFIMLKMQLLQYQQLIMLE
ncbi:MAG: hypothetical protein Ct9H300mP22_0590 [Gammaproteobacteria bacterium]|nr:MAG: hypothetical protein Ct9H300mP22_0590 [Gammaproteobacteria bacterium]